MASYLRVDFTEEDWSIVIDAIEVENPGVARAELEQDFLILLGRMAKAPKGTPLPGLKVYGDDEGYTRTLFGISGTMITAKLLQNEVDREDLDGVDGFDIYIDGHDIPTYLLQALRKGKTRV